MPLDDGIEGKPTEGCVIEHEPTETNRPSD